MTVEFQKLRKNSITYISLFLIILIVLIGAWSGSKLYQNDYAVAQNIFGKFPDSLALVSPSQYWVGLSDSFFSSFFHFIYPLLIALPIVDAIYKENVNGNIYYQLVRTNRKNYFLKKFMFTYIVSFTFFFLPLLIGIVVTNFLTRTWDYTGFSVVYNKLIHGTAILADSTSLSKKKDIFSNLMSFSPYAYILVYYAIGGLYASAYTCFGLSTSLFLKNRYLILFMPMCLYLAGWMAFTLLHLVSWDPFNFLDPRQPVTGLSYTPFIVDFVVLMLITIFLYILGVKRNIDIFS